MKRFIHLLTSVSLATTSSLSWATPSPQEMAQEAVEASLEKANSDALAAIREDMNFALAEVIKEAYSKGVPERTDVRAKLLTTQDDLHKGFKNLAKIDVENVATLKEEAQKAYDRYKELVQERYAASFILPQFRYDTRKSLVFALRAISRFERTCISGRGIHKNETPAFLVPDLPKPDYSIHVSFASNGGSTKGLEAQYTGTGSQGEKNRNTILNLTATTTGYVTSIGLSGSSGAVTAACSAAMPYVWAGGAALAAAMLYLSHAERAKAETEMAEAQIYAHRQRANDEDVGHYYRQHCEAYTAKLNQVKNVLETALNDPQGLEALSTGFGDMDQSLSQYEQLIKNYETTKVEFEVLRAKVRQSKDASEGAHLRKELKATSKKLKELSTKLSEQAKPEKIAQMMAKMILDRRSQDAQALASLNWQAIDMTQKRAFLQIQRLLRLFASQSFAKYFGESGELGKELKAIEEFVDVKLLFKETVAAKVDAIFGQLPDRQFQVKADELEARTLGLLESHGDNLSVVAFSEQVKRFLRIK